MSFSTMASDVDGGDRTGWLYGWVTRGAVPSWHVPLVPAKEGFASQESSRRSDVPIAGEEQVNVSPTATAHDNDNDDTGCTAAGGFFEVGTVHETASAMRGGAMRCKALGSFVGRVNRDDLT